MPYRFNKKRASSGRPRGEKINLNELVKGKGGTRSGPASPTSPTDTLFAPGRLKVNSVIQCITWGGVKPACVEHRWVQAAVRERRLSVDIGDYRVVGAQVSVIMRETHVLELPAAFTEKVVGRCVCIALQGAHLIVQYLTPATSAYTRFLHVDLARRHVGMFEDAVRYFRRSFISQGPVECHLSPGLGFALFLLPMQIKSDRKWSKLLCSVIRRAEEGQHVTHHVTDVQEYGMDRRNQGVAVYPGGERVLYMRVDSYCSFCHAKTQDFYTKNCAEVKISLRAHARKDATSDRKDVTSYSSEESSSDDDLDADLGAGYDHLLQCSVTFCRSGDVILLTCLVQHIREDACAYQVNTYQICASTHALLAATSFPVPTCLACHIGDVDLVTSFPSPCDSYFYVWLLKATEWPIVAPDTVVIRKRPTLKALCRAAILRLLPSPGDVAHLMLPSSLQAYLNFK